MKPTDYMLLHMSEKECELSTRLYAEISLALRTTEPEFSVGDRSELVLRAYVPLVSKGLPTQIVQRDVIQRFLDQGWARAYFSAYQGSVSFTCCA